MAILQAGIIAPSGYQIERSLRFNSADSAYLNRTFTTPTSGNIFTWSGWVKRGTFGTAAPLFGPSYAGGEGAYFNTSNQFQVAVNGAVLLASTPVYRDPSAWYHVVMVSDMGNATASLRFRVYINGVEITSWATDARASYTSFPYWNKNTVVHYLGYSNGTSTYLDGYLTEINFIDGQALTPSSFGETGTDTGAWKPKAYSGSYGTNGFYLKFADNSGTTSTTLGKDSSGNGNNWTPNNFSVTAGAGNDSLVDTPTSYGTDTGVGGEVRGNYCTLNPLDNPNTTYAVSQNGNLYANLGTGAGTFLSGTMHVLGGKYYWEFTPTSVGNGLALGITYGSTTTTDANSKAIFYSFTGGKRIFGTDSAYGASYAANDVIGVAVDGIAGTIEFFKNGTSQGVITNSTISLQQFRPFIFNNSSSASSLTFCNFGQRPFEKWNGSAYIANTAPSGFKALCTQNLPTPTIGATATTRADDYFNTVLYTGTGSSLGVTGVGFQPDWVWIKERSGAADHGLYDAVRGVQKQLESNNTDAETTETTGLTAFNSDGFTVGALAQLNTNTDTYVAWNWKAGGAGSSNTAGTITSTVSANTTSGFSIVTYTGNGTAGATVGHGLGVTPGMIIIKARTAAYNWAVWHTSLGGGNSALQLNSTNGTTTAFNYWNSTNPSSTVFTLGNDAGVNTNTNFQVAYCFAAVAGYSAFGSITGNGSTDGPFCYLGFRPAFVMLKRTDSTSNWTILDFRREGYNVDNDPLYPNLSDAEGTADLADLLSNGFKLRSTDTSVNANGGTYVYAAFAQNPFKYSLAR